MISLSGYQVPRDISCTQGVNGSAGEIAFRWTWSLFVDVYGKGEYGVVDYGFGRSCVCDVAGIDDWVWRSS